MKQRHRDGDGVLPPEIWTEILTKLSVILILRCKTVCKSWYSLISNPNFISHHLLKTLNSNYNRALFKLHNPITKRYSFISTDESLAWSRQRNDIARHIRSGNNRYDLEIVGSCNGLICLYKHKDSCPTYVDSTLVVWNPAIRKLMIELPSPGNRRPGKIWGFGYDPKIRDYKILSVLCYDGTEMIVCEVLNLKDRYWRLISSCDTDVVPPWRILSDGVVPPWTGSDGPAECYLDGAVHWSGPHSRGGDGMAILSFNMSDEVFREISMPTRAQLIGDDGDGYDMSTKCVPFDGLLHVIVCKTGADYYNGGVVSVWAMKEYGVSESWARQRFVDLQPGVGSVIRTDSLFLWGRGEVFKVEQDIMVLPHEDGDEYFGGNMVLVSHNPESGTSRRLRIDKYFMEMCLYTESLALL